MFKAYLKSAEKKDDRIKATVEFRDDTDANLNFEKDYEFNHKVDIETGFEATVIAEAKRINDLDAALVEIKLKIDKEIKAKEV